VKCAPRPARAGRPGQDARQLYLDAAFDRDTVDAESVPPARPTPAHLTEASSRAPREELARLLSLDASPESVEPSSAGAPSSLAARP
jgi:hypothetical protein